MEALWEKIQFWKKKPKMQLEFRDDYDLFQEDGYTSVNILKGKYAGVVYHYGYAQIKEEEDVARVHFDYTIVEPGDFSFDELSEDKELHKIMGDILTEILWSKVEEKELESKTEIQKIKDFDI
jgi:hypothetical protein